MRDPKRLRPAQPSSEWFADTPLSASADNYIRYLTERGYAAGTVKGYCVSVAQFAQWLARHRVALTNLDEALIGRFVNRHLLVCRCEPRCWGTRKEARAALGHLLEMLRASGQCALDSSGRDRHGVGPL